MKLIGEQDYERLIAAANHGIAMHSYRPIGATKARVRKKCQHCIDAVKFLRTIGRLEMQVELPEEQT